MNYILLIQIRNGEYALKVLQLVFFRILQYFKSNKLIFILFIIGGILCSLTFIYFYGNLITLRNISGSNEELLRNYEIYLNQPIDELNDNQKNILYKYPTEKLTVQSQMKPSTVESDRIGSSYKNYMERTDSIFLESSLLNTNLISKEAGRVQFTDDELQQNSHVVILPPDFLDSPEIPETIHIMGKPYQVIGISGSSNNLYIPYTVFENENLKIDHISLMLKNELSDKENQKFERELQEVFPNAQISGSSMMKDSMKKQVPNQLFFVSTIYLLAIISFMFLIKYMIDKNSGDDIICVLVGATRRTILKIILLQNFVLTLIVGIIGIALHCALRNNLFELINTQPNIQYYATDYLLILGMMVVISTIAIIPFLWSTFRHSLLDLKKKYILED